MIMVFVVIYSTQSNDVFTLIINQSLFAVILNGWNFWYLVWLIDKEKKYFKIAKKNTKNLSRNKSCDNRTIFIQ